MAPISLPFTGSRRGSDYPPSYHSGWSGNLEKDTKKVPEEDIRPIKFLKTRAATMGSFTGNEVVDKYGQAKRWITRSGTGINELDLETVVRDRENDHRRFSGWRGGVLLAALSAGSVLLVNLIFTIWAASTSKSGTSLGVIWEGPCQTIEKANMWIHILVNILGTVLLGSSNYTMQCLSSPTRKEVDAAHEVGQYLDIGLPSFRNLTGWKKKLLFGLLVTSTIPLHFLWNSAVFTTNEQLDYQVFVVTPNFFKSTTVDCSQNVSVGYAGTTLGWFAYSYYPSYAYGKTPLEYTSLPESNLSRSDQMWYRADTCSTANALLTNGTRGTLQRLTNQECIQAYGMGDALMSKRGNLLVVTKDQPKTANLNSTILLNFRYEYFVSNYTSSNWVCDPTYINTHDGKCNWKALAETANSEWNLGDIQPPSDGQWWELPSATQWPIDYCLSQTTELGGNCKLQYSLVIMICVICANAVKFSVIFFFLRTSAEPVLATIGDGIASFLERPDTTTVGRQFLTRKQGRNFRFFNRTTSASKPVRYEAPRYVLRWWHGPSLPRWLITLSLCITAIGVAGYLLGQACAIPHPFSSFGTYRDDAVLTNGGKTSTLTSSDFTSNAILIRMVAIANIPQVLVSCLYFAYNTVYTSMVSADEWSRFTIQRKSLRTTDPVGLQRSTYWLSLPWTYALPLASASSVLHWLISQALFVARTEILNTEGEPEPASFMQVGYSPLAILFALLFGATMVLGMVVNGSRKLKGGILVANNSLAIAAACQRPEKDHEAYLKPVMWGALVGGKEGKEKHCCFSSQEVEPPKVGELYI